MRRGDADDARNREAGPASPVEHVAAFKSTLSPQEHRYAGCYTPVRAESSLPQPQSGAVRDGARKSSWDVTAPPGR